ncbi:MAG: DegV family protein, partial [Eggerthellaceae bacterium]|nr:DegV family protein [Eggerthellaceae bacterium]
VLIVDDNDMNRMVARKLLRATRVQTDVAASGREALDKTADVRYDVIFMDHEMPDMDGIQTLQALRDQPGGLNKGAPVVALTANAGSDMNAFYLNQGFQAYLAKPIHGSLLEATLLQFLPSELIERTNIVDESNAVRVGASRRFKRAVAITVDGPCGLPDAMLDEHGIVTMPFYVITEQGRFRDMEEIDADNLFAHLESGGKAHTNPATVEEYEAFFGDMLDRAETVVHLSVSSRVSSAYETARQAADSFGNVRVVDSRQFSSGLGMVALEAARLVESGQDADAVAVGAAAYADKVVATLLVPSMDSPILRSFVPKPLRVVFRAFAWEPVFCLDKRGLRPVGFRSGYVAEASTKFIQGSLRRARRVGDRSLLFVTHSGCSVQEQEEIRAQVEKIGGFDKIVFHKAAATTAANTWMHSIGVIYAKD